MPIAEVESGIEAHQVTSQYLPPVRSPRHFLVPVQRVLSFSHRHISGP